VWAAGVTATPVGRALAAAAGADTDRSGRIKVLPDCTVPGYPEVFVVGDLMALDDLPGVAEVALQAGIHVAATIKRRCRDDETAKPFRYRDMGSMAAVGRYRAIVDFHGIRVAGFLGWLMWAVVHLSFLTGFKNRFLAMFEWLLAFVGRSRDERALTWEAARSAVRSDLQIDPQHAQPQENPS
jgi:NADH dehydrogenase